MLAGQEIEGMGQISGSQALSFLQMMDKQTKLKMLNAIMTGQFGNYAPPADNGNAGDTTDNDVQDVPAEEIP